MFEDVTDGYAEVATCDPFDATALDRLGLAGHGLNLIKLLSSRKKLRVVPDIALPSIDDYLEIRPDQEERLRGHVRSGRSRCPRHRSP